MVVQPLDLGISVGASTRRITPWLQSFGPSLLTQIYVQYNETLEVAAIVGLTSPFGPIGYRFPFGTMEILIAGEIRLSPEMGSYNPYVGFGCSVSMTGYGNFPSDYNYNPHATLGLIRFVRGKYTFSFFEMRYGPIIPTGPKVVPRNFYVGNFLLEVTPVNIGIRF